VLPELRSDGDLIANLEVRGVRDQAVHKDDDGSDQVMGHTVATDAQSYKFTTDREKLPTKRRLP
jgi:hypothetical protein